MEGPNMEALNDALLQGGPEKAEDAGPRRNTKDDLIEKLERLSNEANLELEAKSRLRRMTKGQLKQLLASKMEEAVRSQMAEQVRVPQGAGDSVIALGALRMVHDLCAGLTEKGINTAGARYGYSCDGFAASLKVGTTKEAVDACLQEIAATTDVLGYIESPYARLAICWGSAAIGTLKKVPIVKNGSKNGANASGLGPRAPRREDPVQRSAGGRAANGKEHRSVRFAETIERAV